MYVLCMYVCMYVCMIFYVCMRCIVLCMYVVIRHTHARKVLSFIKIAHVSMIERLGISNSIES
jgi:hypothetical protein